MLRVKQFSFEKINASLKYKTTSIFHNENQDDY